MYTILVLLDYTCRARWPRRDIFVWILIVINYWFGWFDHLDPNESNSIILSKTQDRVSSIKWACFESVLNSINLWISGFSWILSLFYMINYRFWASWRTGQQKAWHLFRVFLGTTNRQTDKQASKQTDRHRTWIFWGLYTKSPFGAITLYFSGSEKVWNFIFLTR